MGPQVRELKLLKTDWFLGSFTVARGRLVLHTWQAPRVELCIQQDACHAFSIYSEVYGSAQSYRDLFGVKRPGILMNSIT